MIIRIISTATQAKSASKIFFPSFMGGPRNAKDRQHCGAAARPTLRTRSLSQGDCSGPNSEEDSGGESSALLFLLSTKQSARHQKIYHSHSCLLFQIVVSRSAISDCPSKTDGAAPNWPAWSQLADLEPTPAEMTARARRNS